jgi:hypothetical protein
MIACENGHSAIAELLLDTGAEKDAKDVVRQECCVAESIHGAMACIADDAIGVKGCCKNAPFHLSCLTVVLFRTT